ncbi:CBO0543 family protein [Bacillus sp. FJAT-45350]|uniref:CBO0543 family protein n=1 Tax=Bacillus sp. FJAT-45350 TaxID=2011014 RepID=UPI00211CCC43|nr:CBO0543 family protein [Bacillus sp. FJAT-45350]
MSKRRDKVILSFSWISMALLLLLFVPKEKQRQAHLAFLFKQLLTWLFGLVVVEKGLIRYPLRIFKKANKTSFTFEYFVYPALCAFFIIYYPHRKNLLVKSVYHLISPTLITLFEYFLVKFTKLIEYKKWRRYWSFLTISIVDLIAYFYVLWFFKLPPKNTEEIPTEKKSTKKSIYK